MPQKPRTKHSEFEPCFDITLMAVELDAAEKEKRWKEVNRLVLEILTRGRKRGRPSKQEGDLKHAV